MYLWVFGLVWTSVLALFEDLEITGQLESLILAQNERWRQA